MPAFFPGGTALITTDANQIASCQLRSAILQALTGDAASRFDKRPDLIYKGFETMTILRNAHAPGGNLALVANFCKLTDLEMGPDKPLTTYMSGSCTIIGLLCNDNVHLRSILINVSATKGLNSACKDVKQDLAIRNK